MELDQYSLAPMMMRDFVIDVSRTPYEVEVRVRAVVHSRETGEAGPLYHREAFVAESWDRMTRPEQVRMVRGTLQRMVAHELDEMLRVNGMFAYDPHTTKDYAGPR